jgi:hypothetical protein
LLVLITAAAAILGQAPALLALLFVPSLVRLVVWTLRQPKKIDFVALGFSELFQSVLFSFLLMLAFLWRQ